MSCYTIFYLGKKNKDGKYELTGPYKKVGPDKFEIRPLMIRSRSFIPGNISEIAEKIAVEEMTEEMLSRFTFQGLSDSGEKHSCGYALSFSQMRNLKRDCGLKVGYAELDEVSFVAHENHIMSSYDAPYLESVEKIAEMSGEERKKYGKTCYIQTDSWGYLLNSIAECVDEWVPYNDDEEAYLLIEEDF